MEKFVMIAGLDPLDSPIWFEGYEREKEFTAANQEEAQSWLDRQCIKAGTDRDKLFYKNRPLAWFVMPE